MLTSPRFCQISFRRYSWDSLSQTILRPQHWCRRSITYPKQMAWLCLSFHHLKFQSSCSITLYSWLYRKRICCSAIRNSRPLLDSMSIFWSSIDFLYRFISICVVSFICLSSLYYTLFHYKYLRKIWLKVGLVGEEFSKTFLPIKCPFSNFNYHLYLFLNFLTISFGRLLVSSTSSMNSIILSP